MTQVPVPEGLGGTPEHGERSARQGTVKGASAQFTDAGSLPYDQEQSSSAATLYLSLLPAPMAGLDQAAVISAARLTLVGVIAPAATIYIAKAAKWPPVARRCRPYATGARTQPPAVPAYRCSRAGHAWRLPPCS